jgi:hypothetical protein
MRRLVASCAAALVVLCAAPEALAQEPPPRIPFLVFDLHVTIPRFPSDDTQLADSRQMQVAELPGAGLGLRAAAQIHLLKVKAVTFGIGAEVATGHASQTPPEGSAATPPLRPADERFSTFAPQLSFNFGNGNGWSYISGGIGYSRWELTPEGAVPPDVAAGVEGANSEALKTINYGGGARWFAKKHLAFTVDARFYGIDAGQPVGATPGSPRTTLFVLGVGISVK